MTNSPFSIAPLFERVKKVVTDPSGCWATVSADSRDPKVLFQEFAFPMAVIGAFVTALGAFVSGFASIVGTGIVLLQCFSAIIMGCAAGFVVAFLATKVGSFLGGRVAFDRAYSWYVHASMVSFVGQVAGIVPFVGPLVALVASFATVYWAWRGIPSMIDVREEKRLVFLIGTILLTMGAFLILSLVFGGALIGSGALPLPQ